MAVGADTTNFVIGEEEGNAEHIKVKAAVRHPRYNLATFSDSDFLLLQLEKEVKGAQTVQLQSIFELPEGDFTVIGVGRTESDNRFSAGGRLKELTKIEVSFDTCNTEMFPGVVNEASMICAGSPKLDGKGDACQGKSDCIIAAATNSSAYKFG